MAFEGDRVEWMCSCDDSGGKKMEGKGGREETRDGDEGWLMVDGSMKRKRGRKKKKKERKG